MTANPPIVFLDTETLGLGLNDPIWEVAAIRRESDGTEARFHVHVAGPKGFRLAPPEGFPSQFRADFDARYGHIAGVPMLRKRALRPLLCDLFRDRPHIVGAVPNFDTERIVRQFGVSGWHYHLIDVENLAVGYLAGRGSFLPPPWDSNDLSRAVGVDPDHYRRHQAMADVEWAMAIYDRITGALAEEAR